MKKITFAAILGGLGTAGAVLIGASISASAAVQVAQADDPALFAALMDEGEKLYVDNCAQCHGTAGEGPVAPPLDGAAILSSRSGTIGIIISGFEDHGMPAWGPVMDDRELAAVSTYVRNAWSNSHGIVLPEHIATRR